jgi:Glycosyl hydrolase family 47/PA domain
MTMTTLRRRRHGKSHWRQYTPTKLSLAILCWCLVSTRAQTLQNEAEHHAATDGDPAVNAKSANAATTATASAGGWMDALQTFQELLRSHVEGADSLPVPPRSEKRAVTNRRGLFEHTLHRHYSKFVPDDVLIPRPKANVQRSAQPSVKESWVDADSGCAIFQEDGNAYWTYHWCPKSHVTQVHLEPSRTEHGAVIQYKATNINKLGIYDPATKYSWPGIDQDERNEFYINGDYCYPSQDKRLRTKTRRETAVVFQTCRNVAESTIVKVIETTPCQYIVRVCTLPMEMKQDDHGESGVDEPSEGLEDQKAQSQNLDKRKRDHRQLVEDIQRVTATYARATGIDQADMENPDQATSLHDALPPFPPSRRKANLDLVREMFTHSYDSYMYHAYPASEVKPLTCRPGTFDLVKLPALTLIDTLDTLVIMGNFTEFARGVERLRDLHKSMQEVEYQGKTTHIIGGGLFSTNANVSLFETNIRVLGGLLSAHQLAVAYLKNQVPKYHVRDTKGEVLIGPIVVTKSTTAQNTEEQGKGSCPPTEEPLEKQICKLANAPGYTRGGKLVAKCENVTDGGFASSFYWTYDGLLLELAHDLGKRMVPAFQTKTGIPYGTVNLVDGIPNGESKVASLAGAGTLSLEFELLSRLTGDESFGNEAKLASRALWMRRSKKDLLGKHINIERGGWTETLSGIGSNSDSFYEYLVKHYILFPEDADFWPMFLTSYYGVHNESRLGEWYTDVDMNSGNSGASRRVFESLMAFYPGMQVLIGELSPAAKTLNSFFMVREAVGLLPERFNYGGWKVDDLGAALHPLRPELLESCYFLHKATQGVSMKRSNRSDEHASSGWLWAGDYALHTIHWHTWAPCGYSAVTGVSPQTTGGIPGSQAKNKRPQALNEMPSFFLSETLKYLYLMFDEDNLLHRDFDRQWVFTTEAHPIHYEPAVQETLANKGTETLMLRRRVRTLLTHRAAGPSRPKPQSRRKTDKWSEKTAEADFMKQLSETVTMNSNKVNTSVARKGCELLEMDIFQPSILPIESATEEFSSSKQDRSNIAHLSLATSGVGMQPLAKACVNIYSPALSWINALNGGATDYANVYVSSVHDEIPKDVRYGVGLLSASHALALYGTGLFLGKIATKGEKVSMKDSTTDQNPAIQRFNMGGDLGEFEVSVYAEGNGFYIKQINSGESMIATVVHDDKASIEADGDENTSPYVMIYASTPPQRRQRSGTEKSLESWLPGMSWKSVFTREEAFAAGHTPNTGQDAKISRSVVIGDASGASFSCELQIVRRITVEANPLALDSCQYPQETEELIDVFPCAPGLFGPTRVPHLTKTKGVTVEGILVPPDPADDIGCESVENTVEARQGSQIQLVNRGSCSFQDKARNQMQLGANAVIVVNTMQNPDELFLMAPGSNKDTNGEDFVVTALISGGDGKELIKLITDQKSESLVAKVVVAPQGILVNDNGILKSSDGSADLRFPILQASPDAIQIFASGGWGVHAVERMIGQATTSDVAHLKSEWQLFLMQHSHVSTK